MLPKPYPAFLIALLTLLTIHCGSSVSNTQGATDGSRSAQRDTHAFQEGEHTAKRPKAIQPLSLEPFFVLTEHIRGLNLLKPVPVRTQTPEEIVAHIRKTLKADELKRLRAVYVALGLLRPELNIEETLVDVMSEQIIGYYDTDDDFLSVRSNVLGPPTGPNGERTPALDQGSLVLVHEMTHALQDQNFTLDAMEKRAQSIDQSNALRALIEGDATLAMIAYIAERSGRNLKEWMASQPNWDVLASQAIGAAAGDDRLKRAPAIVRIPLLASYLNGLTFCARLFEQGGWSAVDAAYKHPPTTMREIMHPELFNKESAATKALEMPVIPALKRAGYDEVTHETLGELETGIFLAQGQDDAAALSAANGWLWDHLRIYERPNRGYAAVWFTLWKDAITAARIERVVGHLLSKHTVVNLRPGDFLLRHANAVLIIRGMDPSLHTLVAQRFTQWVKESS